MFPIYDFKLSMVDNLCYKGHIFTSELLYFLQNSQAIQLSKSINAHSYFILLLEYYTFNLKQVNGLTNYLT